MVRALPRVLIDSKRYFQDDRLKEYRVVDNPHDRITFEEMRAKVREARWTGKSLYIVDMTVCQGCGNDTWVIDRTTLEQGDTPTDAYCSKCGQDITA